MRIEKFDDVNAWLRGWVVGWLRGSKKNGKRHMSAWLEKDMGKRFMGASVSHISQKMKKRTPWLRGLWFEIPYTISRCLLVSRSGKIRHGRSTKQFVSLEHWALSKFACSASAQKIRAPLYDCVPCGLNDFPKSSWVLRDSSSGGQCVPPRPRNSTKPTTVGLVLFLSLSPTLIEI